MKLNILIISFYFPPLPGPASRRWAKFVKYASRKEDVNISVVSAKEITSNVNSNFKNDLKNIKFNHFQFDTKYPKYLERVDLKKQTLLSKIMFKIQHQFIKRKVKGNYWDLSVFWDSYFKNEIPRIIKQKQINKIIISGPPYRYTKFALALKHKFDIELILDYRDPWNDFNDPKTYSKERIDFEIKLEKEVLRDVDKIITVSRSQKEFIFQNQPNCAPIFIIPNGYDPDDCSTLKSEKVVTNKIKLTHFGTLHQQKDYYWKPFFDALKKLKNEFPTIYSSFEIDLLGYTPPEISTYIKDKQLDVKIHGILPPSTAYNLLNQTDIALWFKYDGSPHEFATKFGDYVGLKKHIWTFSVKGEVTEHINTNNIGTCFYRDDNNLTETIFNALLNLYKNQKFEFNINYQSKDIQISEITNKLIDLLTD